MEELDTERLLTVEDVRAAAIRLGGVTIETPLVRLIPRDQRTQRIYLKAESLQPTGSFKLRGAFNAIASLDPSQRQAGVVAHSSGNHGFGVARAARLLGVRATVVVPSHAPDTKLRAMRAEGAAIVTVGSGSRERAEVARELAVRHGGTLIPSANHHAVIAGQATIALEILAQLERLRHGASDAADNDVRLESAPTVLVPIGGGGLAAGVSAYVKATRPEVRVIAVEPALAADTAESLQAGKIVTWSAHDVNRTMADGLRLEAVAPLPFEHVRRYLDGIVLVTEDEIERAISVAAWAGRLIVEPSGAVALAAALFHRSAFAGSDGPIVSVVTGGNVDSTRLLSAASRHTLESALGPD